MTTIADTYNPLLISDINFTLSQLHEAVQDAGNFFSTMSRTSNFVTGRGLMGIATPEGAARILHKKIDITQAVIEKIGSKAFAKRRPEDASAFYAYVQKKLDAKEPLLLRVGFGPIKNVNQCGCRQDPDWAEYLAFVQLSRLMHAAAALYPHGVKAEIVPDDLRGVRANRCPEAYSMQYIHGLQKMVGTLGLSDMISVESGQARLYALYDVPAYQDSAAAKLEEWRLNDPAGFDARFETALDNAAKNMPCTEAYTHEDVEKAAWDYLVAAWAETLSGLWSPLDAFPLRYGRHPNSYQLYTIGFKKTKLPWQISLPFSLMHEKQID